MPVTMNERPLGPIFPASAVVGASVKMPPFCVAFQFVGTTVPTPFALAVSVFALVPTGSVSAIDVTVTNWPVLLETTSVSCAGPDAASGFGNGSSAYVSSGVSAATPSKRWMNGSDSIMTGCSWG